MVRGGLVIVIPPQAPPLAIDRDDVEERMMMPKRAVMLGTVLALGGCLETTFAEIGGDESGAGSDAVDDAPADPALCGNGVLDDGEACDSEVCCSADCEFEPATAVCRAARNPCDIEESCTGDSGVCPEDRGQPSSVECDGGFCSGRAPFQCDATEQALEDVTIVGNSMILGQDYVIDMDPNNGSAGNWVRVMDGGNRGTADATFPGVTGRYDVILQIVAESDGQPEFTLTIDGTAVAESIMAPLGMDSFEVRSLVLSEGVSVTDGASVRLTGDRSEGAWARFIEIRFIDPQTSN